MSPWQAIFLGLAISAVTISIVLRRHMDWVWYIKRFTAKAWAKYWVWQLERHGYFDLTPKDNRVAAKNHLKHVYLQGNLQLRWSLEEELPFDYRSFIIDWHDNLSVHGSNFRYVMETIGLDINIKGTIELSDDLERLTVVINSTTHYITIDHSKVNSERKLYSDFASILNGKLKELKSQEQVIVYGEFPTRLLILTERLKTLLVLN